MELTRGASGRETRSWGILGAAIAMALVSRLRSIWLARAAQVIAVERAPLVIGEPEESPADVWRRTMAREMAELERRWQRDVVEPVLRQWAEREDGRAGARARDEE